MPMSIAPYWMYPLNLKDLLDPVEVAIRNIFYPTKCVFLRWPDISSEEKVLRDEIMHKLPSIRGDNEIH